MSEAELPKLPKLPGKAAPKPKGDTAKGGSAPAPKQAEAGSKAAPAPQSPDPNDLPDPVLDDPPPGVQRVIEETADQTAQATAEELDDPTDAPPTPGGLDNPPDYQTDPATLEDPAGLLTAFSNAPRGEDVWTAPAEPDAANAVDEPEMPGFDPESLADPGLDDQNGPELTISGHHRQQKRGTSAVDARQLESADFPTGEASGGDESAIEILKKLRDDLQEIKQKLENGDYFRLQ